MKTSLIISTYNSPKALKASLESILTQTVKPYEVLVADDGSTDSTPDVIADFTAKAPFKVKHIWQKNKGFRLAMIRNKAIAEAEGDYIIQIDGDILLHPMFIADHEEAARKGHFACGSRVLIDRELTEKIYENPDVTITPFTTGIHNRKNALHSPFLASIIGHLSSKLKYRGCNMAFWKQDLMAVNGYDESYQGWGCEDHDLVARLMNHRILPSQLRHTAICYHLWHPSSKKDDSFQRNNDLLEATRKERRIRAHDGLDKYICH